MTKTKQVYERLISRQYEHDEIIEWAMTQFNWTRQIAKTTLERAKGKAASLSLLTSKLKQTNEVKKDKEVIDDFYYNMFDDNKGNSQKSLNKVQPIDSKDDDGIPPVLEQEYLDLDKEFYIEREVFNSDYSFGSKDYDFS